jgi:hypothetical protein
MFALIEGLLAITLAVGTAASHSKPAAPVQAAPERPSIAAPEHPSSCTWLHRQIGDCKKK